VKGLRIRVYGLRFEVHGLGGFTVYGFGFWVLGFGHTRAGSCGAALRSPATMTAVARGFEHLRFQV
jgi:hypothetical protein